MPNSQVYCTIEELLQSEPGTVYEVEIIRQEERTFPFDRTEGTYKSTNLIDCGKPGCTRCSNDIFGDTPTVGTVTAVIKRAETGLESVRYTYMGWGKGWSELDSEGRKVWYTSLDPDQGPPFTSETRHAETPGATSGASQIPTNNSTVRPSS
ncbi:hypothetical protein M231_06521 [Tremella mesenterica]|uniref:Uncharacterized protein n=1 Tax=Tremella mesenterica TaxID=5217 RepID=A0A4Q1BDC0_TREME|nr:hypothetical protein M231_06521 [Tremella mesenterica]